MGNRQVSALFDAVPEAVVLAEFVDGEPVVREVNDTFERVFGYDADAIEGDSLNEYVVPDDDDDQRQLAREIDDLAAAGETVEREVVRDAADGTREFLFRARPFEESGTVKSMGIYVDVTDRNRERERFQLLIENSSDLITILEADGTIRYESPSIERILGYAPEDLVGENAFDYIHRDDRYEVMDAFEASLDDESTAPEVEYRFEAADGSWRVLESVGSNHIDRPPVEGYVVNSRDVTERRHREQRLEWYRAYVEYQERKRELSEKRVDRNVLEAEADDADDARLRRLESEIEDLKAEIEDLEAELAEIESRYDDLPDADDLPAPNPTT